MSYRPDFTPEFPARCAGCGEPYPLGPALNILIEEDGLLTPEEDFLQTPDGVPTPMILLRGWTCSGRVFGTMLRYEGPDGIVDVEIPDCLYDKNVVGRTVVATEVVR